MEKQALKVDYKISLYPSKSFAYQFKNKNQGYVKLFVSTIWKRAKSFEDFIQRMIYYILLERICLERGFQRIRMKDRCKLYEKDEKTYSCIMERYALEMYKNS